MDKHVSEDLLTPEEKETLEQSPLGTVVLRNMFYRDGYRKLMIVVLAQAVIICGLIVAVVALVIAARPQDRFFATTADGRLVPMVPLSEPNLSQAAVMSWAAQAATDVMTFGFHDYERRLQESANYFTRRGWAKFTEALQEARIIDSVVANQQVITAAPAAAPTMIQEGAVNGVYRWVMDMRLQVSYQSGSSSQSTTMNLRLFIVRVPTLDNPTGLAIQQWIAG